MARILTPRELLERLVAFPTVSRDSNLPLVDWVQDYLEGHGIGVTRVPDATGAKASLYAHAGPACAGAILLSGHSDVVPVDGQHWTTDPWRLSEREGRLYGRGTCDMKGFDALALWALVEAQRRGVSRPLQFALSHDEEVGCLGAPEMIAHMAAHDFPRAQAVIVGEPSMMQVVTGHKGSMGFDLHFRGYEVHSSIPHKGVSAIMEAARLIGWANRINDENAAHAPQGADTHFDPPWTTLHVGEIRGGTAHNITAAECRLLLDFRCVPGDTLEGWRDALAEEVRHLADAMQAVRPEAGIEMTESFMLPALRPEENGAAEALARRLTGDNAVHVVSYGTEAGQFQDGGFSVVVCGPGSIAQAHQPDEYLSLDQFHAGQALMERLLVELQA
ncbi:acetylornithine deacetylase [Rhodovulum imhoffii]|uniref:Acetylornithine deacetylase n=1 Tax=Rhodovulum imhoffii TaxID=365340 RepID=A0A2T5BR79_9RHOB|nr:acetylornithine deacetylase [Rhodovulum imhoffii]MBK5934410.1 acetylornithine deacetylase [Rhodovulum imhoffii]PTN01756.1 acetylornithine deacetylase [Rhodovulum imhoffii]